LSVSENSEANLIYQAGAHIAQSENLDEAFAKIGSVLQEIPYSSALLLGEDDDIVIAQRWPGKNESSNRIIRQLPGKNSLPVSLRAISSYFKSSTPIIIHDIRSASLPQSLMDIPRQMGCDSAAFLPVLRDGKVVSILILGQSKEQKDSSGKRFQANTSYNSESLQPYFYLIDTISSTIEKINSQQDIRKRLSEVQTLWNISQAISVENDLQALYKVIHNQAEKVMGKLSSFAVLLYDDQSGMIQVPYIIEEGKKLEIPPFPMGEGLTSIVMRTGMPLLIVEDMEKNIRELGAKTVGALAKSWLGVPLKYGGETFGVIIAQDIFRENRFSEEDQRLLSTIASQVALVIRNVRLLEISKSQARLERILNQITGKIRRAMDIETILQTTADELAYALNARKARIKIEIAKTPKKNGKHTSLFVDSSSLKS
jgi:GAF domain-containing protein